MYVYNDSHYSLHIEAVWSALIAVWIKISIYIFILYHSNTVYLWNDWTTAIHYEVKEPYIYIDIKHIYMCVYIYIYIFK